MFNFHGWAFLHMPFPRHKLLKILVSKRDIPVKHSAKQIRAEYEFFEESHGQAPHFHTMNSSRPVFIEENSDPGKPILWKISSAADQLADGSIHWK